MAGDWSAIGEVDWWGIERNLHARRDAIGTRRENMESNLYLYIVREMPDLASDYSNIDCKRDKTNYLYR